MLSIINEFFSHLANSPLKWMSQKKRPIFDIEKRNPWRTEVIDMNRLTVREAVEENYGCIYSDLTDRASSRYVFWKGDHCFLLLIFALCHRELCLHKGAVHRIWFPKVCCLAPRDIIVEWFILWEDPYSVSWMFPIVSKPCSSHHFFQWSRFKP